MAIELDWMNSVRAITAAIALFGVLILNRRVEISPLTIYWTTFALSLFCFMVMLIGGDALGPTRMLFGLGAAAACGWSWLFTRALFQTTPAIERWSLGLVLTLVASAYIGDVADMLGVASMAEGAPTRHVVDNLTRMLSSTVLLLPFVEALRTYSPALSPAERKFRLIFLGAFGALIAVTALWMRGAEEGSLAARYEPEILAVAPFIALVLSAAALLYRLKHPLATARQARPRLQLKKSDEPELGALSNRFTARLNADDFFATPNLKVADLAAALGEPEYKVSKAIAATEFANFNRLVNEFRIKRAQDRLRDDAFADQSILTIALDCGFGSIGPFNRAFKEATGVTPRAFRAASKSARSPAASIAETEAMA